MDQITEMRWKTQTLFDLSVVMLKFNEQEKRYYEDETPKKKYQVKV